MHRIVVLFFLLLFSVKAECGDRDSLLNVAISVEYDYPDSAISIVQQRLQSGKLSEKDRSGAYEILGIAQWVKEEYGKAIIAHSEALEIRKSINYKSGVGHSYNNLGLNYQELGDPKLAMQNFLEAQTIAETEKNSSLLAKVLGNIGTLYEEQESIDKALDFYGKSLVILEKGGDQRVLGNTLNNIALVYKQLEEPEKAKNFTKRSLVVRKLIDDKWGIAQSLNLLGLLASDKAEFIEADGFYRSSLEVYKEMDNHWGQSMVYGNLGADANEGGNYRKGLEYCTVSLSIAKEYWLEWEESACRCLAESYTGLEKSNEASVYWKRLVAIKDSVRKENSLSEISLVQKRFEFEKERIASEAEISRQKVLRQASIGLGMAGLLLFLMAFTSYRRKQRDHDALEIKNNEISDKNEEIEEKNLHIMDSIRYAERLQAAILPKRETFTENFTDFHILYKPKDIVSGDFYWLEVVDGLIFLAVADCTGHGVPGAMVSMVGVQGLNKAVLEERLRSPAAILQRLSDHIEEAFEKSGGSVKDGMDICLIAIDIKKREITYSGAHNALWILTSKKELPGANLREEEEDKRMFELKADRRSIGGYFDAGPFTEKKVELKKGDSLFLFSDGFADQFGGPRGKKMGSKRMRETVRKMAISGNLASLETTFEDWKGKEEQVDDVAVVSVQI